MMNKWTMGMLISGILLTASCNDDTEKETGSNSSLVGTWTYESSEIAVDINGLDIVDYLIDLLDLTEAQAEEFADAFTEDSNDFEGVTWKFEADHSFTISSTEETSEGTWSLSEDGHTLTITSEGETDVVDVELLTSTKLNIHILETEVDDFDEDGTDDTISVEVSLSLKK